MYTKGKWEVSNSGERVIIGGMQHPRTIAICGAGTEDKDNALLIAAAPALLEACEIRLASIKRLHGEETAKRTLEYAAIARAKGE